jgi:hypothetical protein
VTTRPRSRYGRPSSATAQATSPSASAERTRELLDGTADLHGAHGLDAEAEARTERREVSAVPARAFPNVTL